MREIDVKVLTDAVRDMCININHELSADMRTAFDNAESEETSPLGARILGQLQEILAVKPDRTVLHNGRRLLKHAQNGSCDGGLASALQADQHHHAGALAGDRKSTRLNSSH